MKKVLFDEKEQKKIGMLTPPMLENLMGIKGAQPANARSPMLVTLFGI